MKKNVWVFGIIAGAILALGIAISVVYNNHIDFDKGVYFGYAMMLLAFSLIFAGVKNFRDKYNNGVVSFGCRSIRCVWNCC